MPKAQRIRETDNPLGQKINAVMAEKQMAGDYAQLAKVFGVATPSTYDWITHGRLGKERFKKLVEWSGRSLDWWFDVVANDGKPAGDTATVNEPTAVYSIEGGKRWPFRVDVDLVRQLGPVDLAMIEGYIQGVVDSRRVAVRKSK